MGQKLELINLLRHLGRIVIMTIIIDYLIDFVIRLVMVLSDEGGLHYGV